MITIDITQPLSRKERILNRNCKVDLSPFRSFIEKMNAGDYHLSFTSLKEFSVSPLSFLRYKTGKKEQTESMKFGNLVHTLILEPEEFDNRYLILSKALPEYTWAKKENREAKDIAESLAASKNMEVVTESDVDSALDIKEAVLGNSFAGPLIQDCDVFEKKTTLSLFDRKFVVKMDALKYASYVVDIKKVADARPEKLRWQMQRQKWHWQSFLYIMAANLSYYSHFYNVCVDGSMNVSVIRQSAYDMMKAEAEIKEALQLLDTCIIGDTWNYSLEFYTESGYYNAEEI